MSNTKVDTVVDQFISIQSIYQLNSDEMGEFQDRINVLMSALWKGAKDTEYNSDQEQRSDNEEEKVEIDDDDYREINS